MGAKKQPKIERMWINQPSTLQPYHNLHGTNVLAVHEYDKVYQVYFLSGDTISQQIDQAALSPGWMEKEKTIDLVMVRYRIRACAQSWKKAGNRDKVLACKYLLDYIFPETQDSNTRKE